MTCARVWRGRRLSRGIPVGLLVIVLVAWTHAISRGQIDPVTERTPGILFLVHDDPDRPYATDVVAGFRETLQSRPNFAAPLYIEYFDQIRFGDRPTYTQEFVAWLHQKYRDRPIGVIVVVQQRQLQLAAQAPDNPWNDVPVVYGSLGALGVDISKTHPTATGVVMENHFPQTLSTIKALLPETRRIAIVRGAAASERARDDWWVPQIREAGFDVLDLSGLEFDALLPRVASLPQDTVPLVISLQRDPSGRTFRYSQGTAVIAQRANRPLFTLLGDNLPNGLIGGPSPDVVLGGRVLAEHALDRLAGRARATEVIPAPRHVRMQFDARELARWGIPESRLPAGSVVRHRQPSLWRDYRGTVALAVAIGATQMLLIAVVLAQRQQRAATQAALEASYADLQRLAQQLVTSQEQERTRVARELHDDIGQRVASLSIALSRVKREAEQESVPLVSTLSAIQEQASSLSTDVRRLSHELHPSLLKELGLVEALRAHLDVFMVDNNLPGRLSLTTAWHQQDPTVELCLYRVVQEALRNVVQHARATRVDVVLSQVDDVQLEVRDDGIGFEHAKVGRGGLGLISLGERVRNLGGHLEVGSTPDQGTTLRVRLARRDRPGGDTLSAS